MLLSRENNPSCGGRPAAAFRDDGFETLHRLLIRSSANVAGAVSSDSR